MTDLHRKTVEGASVSSPRQYLDSGELLASSGETGETSIGAVGGVLMGATVGAHPSCPLTQPLGSGQVPGQRKMVITQSVSQEIDAQSPVNKQTGQVCKKFYFWREGPFSISISAWLAGTRNQDLTDDQARKEMSYTMLLLHMTLSPSFSHSFAPISACV